jgi:3'-phosphoadenosine 5'-phosphosulfate sulfotransferase (PAPS reductase)/FAD synthetase
MFDDIEFWLVDFKSRLDKLPIDKYYLSYSGGRDSERVRVLIKHFGRDDIEIVACNTYMEHHEIRERMYKYADVVLQPKMKPFEIKEKYGIPCFSKFQDDFIDRYQRGSRTKSTLQIVLGKERSQFKLNDKARILLLNNKLHKISPKCCKYLKKEPFKDYEKLTSKKAILGVRGVESNLRKSKYKSCFTKDKKFTPFYDLSDEMANKIDEYFDIKIPKVYEHINRTGCMGCPYGSHYGNTVKELELLNDNQFKFVCEYFKESYEVLGINTKEVQMKLF